MASNHIGSKPMQSLKQFLCMLLIFIHVNDVAVHSARVYQVLQLIKNAIKNVENQGLLNPCSK